MYTIIYYTDVILYWSKSNSKQENPVLVFLEYRKIQHNLHQTTFKITWNKYHEFYWKCTMIICDQEWQIPVIRSKLIFRPKHKLFSLRVIECHKLKENSLW